MLTPAGSSIGGHRPHLSACNPRLVPQHPRMRFFPILSILIFLAPALGVYASGRSPAPHRLAEEGGAHPVVPVKQLARSFGFHKVVTEKDRILLKGEVHNVILFHGSRRSLVNGTLVWLNEPMVVRNGSWVLSGKDVTNTLLPLLRPTEFLGQQGFQVVVLDPGHGGNDSGAVSPTGLKEKELVLDVAHRVRALLQSRGVTVYLTRHDDRFLELEERPRRAERWKADLLVSLHANSGINSARGVETFALSLPGSLSTNQDPDTAAPTTSVPGNVQNQANMALAYALQHSLRSLPETTDRGVKRARFTVLRSATTPTALVEMGFLTHPEEGKRFHDPAWRERMAHSIARGIDNYLRAVKTAKMNEVTSQQEK